MSVRFDGIFHHSIRSHCTWSCLAYVVSMGDRLLQGPGPGDYATDFRSHGPKQAWVYLCLGTVVVQLLLILRIHQVAVQSLERP